MAGTTTRGYHYPTGTDRVMDGDNAIQQLAEDVNKSVQAGSGNIPAGGTLAVTFPVPFTNAAPVVVVVTLASGLADRIVSATSPINTGFTAACKTPAGAFAAGGFYWVAVGPV